MVRVAIDDEGLTISSPGGFIEGVNLNNLLTVEPHGRNQTLADALKRIGLAERTGRGIDRIFEGSIHFGRPWPDYTESTERCVKLFIQRAKPDMAFIKMISDEENRLGRSLPINSLLILSALKNERRLNINRIAEITHIGVNRAKANVEKLIESGLVEALGMGKAREYILSAKVYRRIENAVGYVRQSGIDSVKYPELIIKLAQNQNGYVTREDVVKLLNLSETQAYRTLATLKEQGVLVLEGTGRGAKYKSVK